MRLKNPFAGAQPNDYVSIQLEERAVEGRNHVDQEQSLVRPSWNQGWRGTVLGGMIAAIVVLLSNICILGWAGSLHQSINGGIVLYDGDCGRMNVIGSVWHILINILSTLLLGASNACSQSTLVIGKANDR